ncbi:MAG: hypothetical protein ACMG55_09155 [Microcoleus sp.]
MKPPEKSNYRLSQQSIDSDGVSKPDLVSCTAFKLYWAIGRHIKNPQILSPFLPIPLPISRFPVPITKKNIKLAKRTSDRQFGTRHRCFPKKPDICRFLL